MHSTLEIIALIGALILIIIYYQDIFKSFFHNSKETFLYSIVIIFVGYLFYLLFH